MVEIIKNTEEEADEFIRDFSDKFYSKFGVYPRISYSFKNDSIRVSLKDLEEIANHLIHTDLHVDLVDATIKTKSRQRTLVIYRQCIFKIARDIGYGLTRIGEYFGYDHATVLYSNRNINNLINCKDKQVLRVLNRLEDELKKRHRNDGDVQPDHEGRIDT